MPKVQLYIPTDSSKLADSQKDSLLHQDSLRLDSLNKHTELHTIYLTRYQGKVPPSFPNNESWIFGLIIVFFLIFVYSLNKSFGWMRETIKNFWKKTSDSALFTKTTLDEYQSRAFLTLFSVSVLSLYLYFFYHIPGQAYEITGFGKLLLANLIFIAVKEILVNFVGYVFVSPVKLKMAKGIYYELLGFLGVLYFPVLIFRIYVWQIPLNYLDIAGYILVIFVVFLLIIKLFDIFYTKILDLFYILLYLCTLEIMSYILLFKAYRFILVV